MAASVASHRAAASAAGSGETPTVARTFEATTVGAPLQPEVRNALGVPSPEECSLSAMHSAKRSTLGFILELRLAPVLQWSFTGVVLGAALASRDGAINPGILIASILVAALVHGVVSHCSNDIVDWRSGTDAHPSERALSGGSKVLGLGLLSQRGLLIMGVLGGLAATVGGIVIAAQTTWWLLALGLGGLLAAAGYSLPPVSGTYRPGAGEIVASICGWICVFGSDVAQRGTGTLVAAAVALHWVLSCMAMVLLHHIPDREADLAATPPKRTTVAVIGAHPQWYAAAWPAVGGAVGAWVAWVEVPELWPSVVGAFLAAIGCLVVNPEDLASVTRGEISTTLVVMAGGLVSAAILEPAFVWLGLVPLVLLSVDELARRSAAKLSPGSVLP
jgi:1,4-dihydroxy-2-naphthoate polyprenyltransferase